MNKQTDYWNPFYKGGSTRRYAPVMTATIDRPSSEEKKSSTTPKASKKAAPAKKEASTVVDMRRGPNTAALKAAHE